MPRHRFTQADVAAMAWVSQSTVSFVLNGNAPAGVRISEETRSRVLDAIRITGYSANPVAKRLAGGRNQILGVFTYELTFPARRPGLLRRIPCRHRTRCGEARRRHAAVHVGAGRRGAPPVARDGWQRLGIADGCLLLGQHEDRGELQHLLDTNYPFVFIGKRVSEGRMLPYVGADYITATSRQVERSGGGGAHPYRVCGAAVDRPAHARPRRGIPERDARPMACRCASSTCTTSRVPRRRSPNAVSPRSWSLRRTTRRNSQTSSWRGD